MVGIFNLLLGLAVLSRDWRKKVNIMFMFISVSLTVWIMGIAAFLLTKDLGQALVLGNLYYAAAFGIAMSLMGFSWYWVDEKPAVKRVLFFAGLFVIYCLLLIRFPDMILEEVYFKEEVKNVRFNVLGQAVYSLLFMIPFFAAVLKLTQKLPRLHLVKRSQTKFIIFGIISAGAVGLTFNLVMPWFGLYGQIWVGPLFSVFFAGFVSYAIAKHKLFDFHRAVARALAYIISLGTLILIYALMLFALSGTLLSEQGMSLAQRIFFIGFSLFVALIFQPLKRFFDKVTNKYFYRDAYDPEDLLNQLNSELITNIELEVLLRNTSEVIQKALKSESCLVILEEKDNISQRVYSSGETAINESDINLIGAELHKLGNRLVVTDDEENFKLKTALSANNIAVIVPIFPGENGLNNKQVLAYLALGPKKSGNIYARQDLQIIQIIADELVIAIQNALRFEEIQGFAATLEQKVKEATAELKAANRKLKELDASKDEFISMASHQLRTPLTSVKGYLSMVLEGDAGKLNKMQHRLLDQAFVSSQRMVFLIADLLNVSRLKTGKFIIESKPTDLAQVVDSELSQLRETMTARSLTLKYEKPKSFPRYMLDETKIRQVVMNFIDNAIYYTPPGGTIEVKIRDTAENIEFTVKDSGIGVPKSERHHLFTKFYRAGNAQKARPDGTGLGLFMAKKVIIAQGGSIIFSSTEGKGSTFGFKFAKSSLAASS